MEQEYKSVAIIGAGASGCICAYYLLKAGIEVTLFDYGSPLRTILPTGGGRCNLAHAEYNFKELAANYPRGEKFLYSVFSKFSTYDTLDLFNELGVKTYTQDDGRIFPVSNSAKEVRTTILKKIKGAKILNERVTEIDNCEDGFKITTSKPSSYYFTHVIAATGGKSSKSFLQKLNHNIIKECPSLVGLNTNIKAPSGIVLNNVYSKDLQLYGDILFTHYGISGPLVYKISSIKAFDKFPYTLTFDLYDKDLNLQQILNDNPQKELKNILSKFLPINFVKFLIDEYANIKACNINGKIRDEILKKIHNYEIVAISANKGEETVTAGGIDLNEVVSQTMQSKLHTNLYFIGEVLNIDGFCGGFNLQNAWSTAFVASQTIINN